MKKIAFSYSVRHFPWQWNNARKYCFNDQNNLSIEFDCNTYLDLPSSINVCMKFSEKAPISVGGIFRINKEYRRLYHVPHTDKVYLNYLDNTVNHQIMIENYNFTQDKANNDLIEYNKKLLSRWLSFFDELFNESKKRTESVIPYSILGNIIKALCADNEPQLELIVRISEVMNKQMPLILTSLRKILVAKRQMLPMNKINELDSKCLSWIARQPGKDIKEKAASHNFKLLGIDRQENFDLLENRVFKDFITRCHKACLDYLNDFPKEKYKNSPHRLTLVNFYKIYCEEVLKREPITKISRQLSIPQPNYVLQNDMRYKDIWKFYLKLLRQEQEIDNLWLWQDNTFKDVCTLLLHISLIDNTHTTALFKLKALGESFINIFPSQLYGKRILESSFPGPFFIKKENVILNLINLEREDTLPVVDQRLINNLSFLGTPLFMEFNGINRPTISLTNICAIYYINLLNCQSDIKNIIEDANNNLDKAQQLLRTSYKNYRLQALIICMTNQYDKYLYPTNSQVHIVMMKPDPNAWKNTVQALGDEIQNIIRTALL